MRRCRRASWSAIWGDGVVEAAVAAALEAGRLKKRQRRRIMSYPLVIRLMIAMALMPDASYCESLARLTRPLAGMMVCAADGSAPFPQLRVVALTARARRAIPGTILGSSAAGEQTLLKRLGRRGPDLFAGRVMCLDRNFHGIGKLVFWDDLSPFKGARDPGG